MSTSFGRGPALALAVALAALLVAGVAPVLGHADLVSSDPADAARLATPPTTITLTFSEGLAADRSSFLLDLDGTTIGTGKAARDADTTMTLSGLSLEPGEYVIRWTSVADDGDLLRGTITFAVLEPALSPTVTPLRTDDNSGPPPEPTPSPSAAAVTPSPHPSSDARPAASSGTDVLLPIVLGLLVVAGIGAFLLLRSRRA